MRVYIEDQLLITIYLDKQTDEIEKLKDGKKTLKAKLRRFSNGETLETAVTLKRDIDSKDGFKVKQDGKVLDRDDMININCKKLDIWIGNSVYDTTLEKYGFAISLGYGGIELKERNLKVLP